jgi:predicted amidophosphoribosyltransferase
VPEPYVEITCSDCGAGYEPDDGHCPACGSSNCSYDGALMAEWQRWQRERDEFDERWPGFR